MRARVLCRICSILLQHKAHGDGWFLLRLSLHDPILPLNIESDREHGARTIARQLAPFLAQQVNIDASSALEFTL